MNLYYLVMIDDKIKYVCKSIRDADMLRHDYLDNKEGIWHIQTINSSQLVDIILQFIRDDLTTATMYELLQYLIWDVSHPVTGIEENN